MSVEANMELNAAHALLQLQCAPGAPRPGRAKLEIEGAATLFLNCLPSPKTPSTSVVQSPPPASNTSKLVRHSSIHFRDESSKTNSPAGYNGHKYMQKHRHVEPAHKRRDGRQIKKEPLTKRNLFNDHESNAEPRLHQKSTRDMITQTDVDGSFVSELYATISSLRNQLNELKAANVKTSSSQLAGKLDPAQQNITRNKRKSHTRSSSSSNTAKSSNMNTDESDDEWSYEDYTEPKGNDNMVPIGEGYARVPARLLKQIDWSSYTVATRKLLTAVFSRDVLATHSLTGKSSPAFPGKPAKKRLDPELVNDIVQTVCERTNASASVVRTSITTKCADESKMWRTRMQNEKKMNQENCPPTPRRYSSDRYR